MRASVAAICLSIVGLSGAAQAQAAAKKQTAIPAQGLGPALQGLARERDFQLVYVSEEVDALLTQGAVGELTSEEALEKLLAGTGLTFKYLDDRTVTIVPRAPARSTLSSSATYSDRASSAGKGTGKRELSTRRRPVARGARFASATSALLLGLAAGEQTFAQAGGAGAQGSNLEEIVVTGIRGSLRRATEI
jgi:hypothetical protein